MPGRTDHYKGSGFNGCPQMHPHYAVLKEQRLQRQAFRGNLQSYSRNRAPQDANPCSEQPVNIAELGRVRAGNQRWPKNPPAGRA